MYCKNCGNAISDTALFCDRCGHPARNNVTANSHAQQENVAESGKKNVIGVILCVFAGLLVFSTIMSAINRLAAKSPDDSNTGNWANSSEFDTNTDINNNSYSAGMYKVGVDIEEGEYYVYCVGSNSCYFEVSSDSSGQLASIVANDSIETFAFVSVKEGQYLKVNRGQFVKAADATVPGPDINGNYGTGMYRVGIDIPAGEYKVTCTESLGCYIEISGDCFHTLSSIISNDHVETFAYITVTEGQYLTVNRGQFVLVE